MPSVKEKLNLKKTLAHWRKCVTFAVGLSGDAVTSRAVSSSHEKTASLMEPLINNK